MPVFRCRAERPGGCLLYTSANLTRSRLNQIAFAIDDLLLPYQFDLSIFHKLTNMELVDHIRRVGISIFCKDCSQPPA